MAARINAGLDMPIFMTITITTTVRIKIEISSIAFTTFKSSPKSIWGVGFCQPSLPSSIHHGKLKITCPKYGILNLSVDQTFPEG
jgi:hypothetical protein